MLPDPRVVCCCAVDAADRGQLSWYATACSKRYVGIDGKIVNELIVPATVDAPAGGEQDTDDPAVREAPDAAALVDQLGPLAPPGSSAEQRAAERVMLDLLGADLGLTLNLARITAPSGERAEVNGADADHRLCSSAGPSSAHRKPLNGTRCSPAPSDARSAAHRQMFWESVADAGCGHWCRRPLDEARKEHVDPD